MTRRLQLPGPLAGINIFAPTDRVASTGAFVPANGEPTLMFVDAIW